MRSNELTEKKRSGKIRPSKLPTVSTPLEWKEINKKLDPAQFDIHNTMDRIKKKGDLFKGVMEEKIRIKNSRILRKLLTE